MNMPSGGNPSGGAGRGSHLMRHVLALIIWASLPLLAVAACGDEEDGVTTAPAGATSTAGAASPVVSTRTATAASTGTPGPATSAEATPTGKADATPGATAPNVPDIVWQRIEQVRVAIAAGRDASTLSDSLVQVNAQGELRLEFHSVVPASAEQQRALEDLGASIESVLPPSGTAGPAVVVAWTPFAVVKDAAALPWVAAVRPTEASPPDSVAD